MRVCFHGFLAQNHSWSIVCHNIARQLINRGHLVDMMSTNGKDHFPQDLLPNLTEKLDNDYDMQISYTAPHNFGHYLNHSTKNRNRFGIWCYEWPVLPKGMTRHYKFVDKILAPSTFARDIFIKNGISPDVVALVPHGITFSDYNNTSKLKVKTNKSKIIGINIGQCHLRKNIAGALAAYGVAFTKNDDVCLLAKIHTKSKINNPFETDINEMLKQFYKQFPNHAEIELVKDYVPNIVEFYNVCDIVYTLSYAEGFYMPGLEALACNKINVAPRYGGQLDFLNDHNSLLVDGKLIRADKKMQYWEQSPYNSVFESDINDAAAKLRHAVDDYDSLISRFQPNMKAVASRFTWELAVDKIIALYKE